MEDAYLYDRGYFELHYAHDLKRERMYHQEYRRITQRIGSGRILDIGCGTGGFLACFGDEWKKYGYEPSGYAATLAKEKGVYMISDISSLASEQLDVVVFRGTIQHIAFPMTALSQAARLLRPGGLLVLLATPDADSLVYRIWGRLPALEAERNWIVFGSRCLANILQRLGFSEIDILKPYRGTPYARPVSDVCQFFVSVFFGWRPFAFPGNMIEIYAVKP